MKSIIKYRPFRLRLQPSQLNKLATLLIIMEEFNGVFLGNGDRKVMRTNLPEAELLCLRKKHLAKIFGIVLILKRSKFLEYRVVETKC